MRTTTFLVLLSSCSLPTLNVPAVNATDAQRLETAAEHCRAVQEGARTHSAVELAFGWVLTAIGAAALATGGVIGATSDSMEDLSKGRRAAVAILPTAGAIAGVGGALSIRRSRDASSLAAAVSSAAGNDEVDAESLRRECNRALSVWERGRSDAAEAALASLRDENARLRDALQQERAPEGMQTQMQAVTTTMAAATATMAATMTATMAPSAMAPIPLPTMDD